MTVEERITNLENANRQWRRLTVGMVLFVALFVSCSRTADQLPTDQASAATGVAKPDAIRDTLRLRKLEIVNDQGKTLATFDTFGGFARLELGGTREKGRILMFAGGPICHAAFSDRNGRVALAGVGITVGSALTEDDRAQISSLNSDDPEYYAKLKTLVQIASGKGGLSGFINVYNPCGKKVVSMRSNKTNEGVVYVYDVNGKVTNGLSSMFP